MTDAKLNRTAQTNIKKKKKKSCANQSMFEEKNDIPHTCREVSIELTQFKLKESNLRKKKQTQFDA